MNHKAFQKYLATGEYVLTMDAAIAQDAGGKGFQQLMARVSEAGKKAEAGKMPKSLAEHDKQFHPGGYKEGDSCKFRENLAKKDDADDLSGASSKEEPAVAKKYTNEEIRDYFNDRIGKREYESLMDWKDMEESLPRSDKEEWRRFAEEFGNPWAEKAANGEWVPGLEFIEKTDASETRKMSMAIGAVELGENIGEITPDDGETALAAMNWETKKSPNGCVMIRFSEDAFKKKMGL